MIYESCIERGKKVLIAWDSYILLFFFMQGFLLDQQGLEVIWSHV